MPFENLTEAEPRNKLVGRGRAEDCPILTEAEPMPNRGLSNFYSGISWSLDYNLQLIMFDYIQNKKNTIIFYKLLFNLYVVQP